MAKVTDFKKLKQRQARRRAFKLAGLAGVILAIAYLLSSLVNSPEFAGLSSLGDMIKGGPGYPIDAPGGKIKGMYQNDSGIILPAVPRCTAICTAWETRRYRPAER